MKPILACISFLFFTCSTYSQNMVIDPSFEQYGLCPGGLSAVDSCIWWSQTGQGTSDYFNICNTGIVGVPTNFLGYQAAYTGNAYAGFIIFSPGNYREYVSGNLLPLTVGQSYKVIVHTSRSDWPLACDGIGVFFYQNGINCSLVNPYVLPLTPQIDYSPYGPILDAINWVTLTDTLYADSAYTHIIIGNFKDNINTDTIGTSIYGSGSQAYYYIDSVIVEAIPFPLTAVVSQNNVFCHGDSSGTATVTPSGGLPPYTYLWSNGQTTQTAISLSAATYTCTITDFNNSSFIQAVTITQPAVSVIANVGGTTPSICAQQNGSASVVVTMGVPPYSYQWLPNGGSNATAVGLATGVYTCSVTDANGCADTAVAVVNEASAFTLSAIMISATCFGTSSGSATITTSGGLPPYTYLWNNGQTTQTAANLVAGTYTVTVTDANSCTNTRTVTVTEPDLLIANVSGVNVNCYDPNSGAANVSVSGGTPGYIYLWNNGQTTPIATGLAAGSYTVMVTDSKGCTASNIIAVENALLSLVDAGNDEIYCYGKGILTLHASGANSYVWSPAYGLSCTVCNAPLATPATTTTYTLTGTDVNGCVSTDIVTITVFTKQPISTGSDEDICVGESVQLFVSGGNEYDWSPVVEMSDSHVNDPVVSPIRSTIYTVIIKQNECFSDTVSLSVAVHPIPSVSLGPDIRSVMEAIIQLHADTSNATTVTWSPSSSLNCDNCIDPVMQVKGDISYVVTASNGVCIAEDTINITTSCNEKDIFFANTFTPNKDNINDYFFPQSGYEMSVAYMAVYDRWGTRIFERENFKANDPQIGWDGTFHGKQLDPDTFIYYVQFLCGNGQKILLKGDVSIVK